MNYNMAMKQVAGPEDWCRACEALLLVDREDEEGVGGDAGER